MPNFKTVITNNALNKGAQWGLSEAAIMDAFNNGETEKKPGGIFNAIKKYPGYEVGVMYKQDERGVYVILSVWKRGRR
jgi:hypothetical protein